MITTDHYAKIQMIQGPKKRSEVIEEARKKYFFYEDGTPTFRIMEEYDDKGNRIEEPELWRPVGMDVNTYNKRIEEAKSRADQVEVINTIDEPSPKTPSKETTKHSEKNEGVYQSDYWSSVQCAQRQRSIVDLRETRIKQTENKKKDAVVDLVTPEASKNTYTTRESFTAEKSHVSNEYICTFLKCYIQ
jgi:hypothetical protein